jgi:hypothetical protein
MLLEMLVQFDMVMNGYDPNSKIDVDKYWQERL